MSIPLCIYFIVYLYIIANTPFYRVFWSGQLFLSFSSRGRFLVFFQDGGLTDHPGA